MKIAPCLEMSATVALSLLDPFIQSVARPLVGDLQGFAYTGATNALHFGPRVNSKEELMTLLAKTTAAASDVNKSAGVHWSALVLDAKRSEPSNFLRFALTLGSLDASGTSRTVSLRMSGDALDWQMYVVLLKECFKTRTPLHWATVGYRFESFPFAAEAIERHHRDMFINAWSHPCVDVGDLTMSHTLQWRQAIRTVGWLTALSTELLQGKSIDTSAEDFGTVQKLGDTGQLIQLIPGSAPPASDSPELLEAYRRGNRLFRPLLPTQGVNWTTPWTEESSLRWIHRLANE